MSIRFWTEPLENREKRMKYEAEKIEKLKVYLEAVKERVARERSWRGEVNRYTVDECS